MRCLHGADRRCAAPFLLDAQPFAARPQGHDHRGAGRAERRAASQKAFVEELAPQCGFCTPGQIMSAVALLKVNPKPTRNEARQAMSGNLCRCGAYDHYLNAVMRAAREA